MTFRQLFTKSLSCSDEQFQIAVEILIRKPNVCDKRLVGAVLLAKDLLPDRTQQLPDEPLPPPPSNLTTSSGAQQRALQSDPDLLDADCTIARRLVPKAPASELWLDHVTWRRDQSDLSALFTPSSASRDRVPKFAYRVGKLAGQVFLASASREGDADADADERRWLERCVFDPLCKWCSESGLSRTLPSIRLVNLVDYHGKYLMLKEKYGKKLVENWSESTDPEKFVHEDLAIASYLLCLWESGERELREENDRVRGKKVCSFLDLGCGNGLLVYILTLEGHKGTGVDIRSRKIWKSFGQDVDLRVDTVTPSLDTDYSQYDWLIGNHSDELTPWIPVMAAVSRCSFFLLPCCPFEFTKKFQRRNTKETVYRDYLNYVKEAGEKCGFLMEEDRLRIPSTKRICFVGRATSHSSSQRSAILQNIRRMVEGSNNPDSSPSAKRPKPDSIGFVARSADVSARNCTQLPRTVTDRIVGLVVRKCLEEDNPVGTAETNPGRPVAILPVSNPDWNCGGKIPLSELAQSLVPADLLQQLKSESGGLQTLLRNHNHIFVVEGGAVRLRCHATDAHGKGKRKCRDRKASSQEFRKKRQCWFHLNHPQGCVVAKEDCVWAHGEDDLAS